MKSVNRIARLTVVALITASGLMQAGATTLAQFNLDAMTGKVVTDISGNNHNATFTGSPVLSTNNPFPGQVFGVPDMSIDVSVDGTIAFLAHPETIDLNTGGRNKFTFEGWIRPTTSNYMTLVECDASAYSGYYSLGTMNDGTPLVRFYSGSGWFGARWSNALPLNVWTHLAGVYNADSDAILRLYVNGVEVASTYVAQAICAPCDGVYFGGGGGLGQVKGLIDDIRISNEALAPSQLGFHQSFTRTTGPVTNNLVFWADANDLDGNGAARGLGEGGLAGSQVTNWVNKAAVNGAPSAAQIDLAYAPTLVTKKLNNLSVVRFDGVDDFLQSAAFSSQLAQTTEVFMVWCPYSDGGNASVALDGLSATARQNIAYESGGHALGIYAGAGFYTGGSRLNPQMITVTFNGSSSAIRINGMDVTTGDAGTNALDGVTLGGRYDLYGGDRMSLDGYIAEVLIYSAPLNATDRDSVENYLNSKWIPPHLPQLVFWADANDLDGDGTAEELSEAGLSGNQATNWVNKAAAALGAVNAASQTNLAYAPTLTPNGLNKRPVVLFDGIGDFLQSAAFPSQLAQPTEVYMVWYPFSNGGGDSFALDGLSATARQAITYELNNAVLLYAGGAIYTGGTYLHPQILTATFNGSSSAIRINGTNVTTGYAGDYAQDGITLGGRFDLYFGDRLTLDGYIAEVLIYKSPLSSLDRDTVESYLYQKWFVPPPPKGAIFKFM